MTAVDTLWDMIPKDTQNYIVKQFNGYDKAKAMEREQSLKRAIVTIEDILKGYKNLYNETYESDI